MSGAGTSTRFEALRTGGDTRRATELTFQFGHSGGACPILALYPDLLVTIEIVDYDPNWPALFEEEAAHLRAVLDQGLIAGLEHYGSTSIPGLAAKPIIDILILVRCLAVAGPKFVEPLQRLGYVFRGRDSSPEMFFIKGISAAEDRRTHFVHITEPGRGTWKGLCFRDYLRAHPDEAARYEHLKRELANRYQSDRFNYARGKRDFITRTVLKARRQGAP
jgi:GrpB-like predicted nucleotidyltransferase (UPF0157 family)